MINCFILDFEVFKQRYWKSGNVILVTEDDVKWEFYTNEGPYKIKSEHLKGTEEENLIFSQYHFVNRNNLIFGFFEEEEENIDYNNDEQNIEIKKLNHKYIQRTGSPGNYQYVYPEDLRNKENQKENQKENIEDIRIYDKPIKLIFKKEGKKIEYPIKKEGPPNLSKELIKESIINTKKLGIKSEIVILNYSSSEQNGFNTPYGKKNTIYIMNNVQRETIFGASDLLLRNGYKKESKIVDEITEQEMVEKTIMHEQGHILCINKFGNYLEDPKDKVFLTFFDKVSNQNKEFKKYMDLVDKTKKGTTNYIIGEIIAEDYRIALGRKNNHNTYLLPNSHTFSYDLINIKESEQRQEIIFKILEV